MRNWKDAVISSKDTIRDAMRSIDRAGVRMAVVADAHFKLLGTVTDGDIRRGLLRNLEMSDLVSEIMSRSPLSARLETTREERLELLEKHELLALPIVDASGVIVSVSSFNQLMRYERRDNPVFIMAGGFGTRLKPLTNNCPKPMLPIGGRPILDHILERFIKQGFHRFYISTHFMPEMITDYFGDGTELGCEIIYVHENTPLGTGGALGLLPRNAPRLPLVMMNGDVLTDIDFTKIIDFHGKNECEATMCVRELEHQVAYGVVEAVEGVVHSMIEKPVYRHLINTGIYVLSPDTVASVEKGCSIDLPSLLEKRKNDGFTIGAYRSRDYWLDIGRMADYQKAQEDIKLEKFS